MSTWLLTGARGFLGGHALQALHSRGGSPGRVVLLGRHRPEAVRGIDFDFRQLDLGDADAVMRAVREVRPDFVIHAAGATPPQTDPRAFFRINVEGTRNLLASLSLNLKKTRVVLVGSAAELGPVPSSRMPINEDCPCRPADAYGLSKWAATRFGLAASPPLEVVVARVFNPIGPGLPESSAFGRYAAILASSSDDPVRLEVAGSEVRRDFIDIRDVAEALVALARLGRPGTLYHVGSGQSRSIGEGVSRLIGLSGRRVEWADGGPGRPPLDSVADIARIRSHAGWSPRRSFEESLALTWASAAQVIGVRKTARVDAAHAHTQDVPSWTRSRSPDPSRSRS